MTQMKQDVDGIYIAVFYSSLCDRINVRLQHYFWPDNLQTDPNAYHPTMRRGWRWARWPIGEIICWFADRGIARSRKWTDIYRRTGELPALYWKRRK